MDTIFISRDCDEAFVLPQDVRDWLPAGHLCWYLLAVVDGLDLSEFMAGYRVDGQGRSAYHPAAMLSLVLYCYSKGIRSSRRIEAACVDDVGCRIIAANRRVDHATIARFLLRHRSALRTLFIQVLAIVRQRARVERARAWLERARHPRPTPAATARASRSDPDSRLMLAKHGGYVQAEYFAMSGTRVSRNRRVCRPLRPPTGELGRFWLRPDPPIRARKRRTPGLWLS